MCGTGRVRKEGDGYMALLYPVEGIPTADGNYSATEQVYAGRDGEPPRWASLLLSKNKAGCS